MAEETQKEKKSNKLLIGALILGGAVATGIAYSMSKPSKEPCYAKPILDNAGIHNPNPIKYEYYQINQGIQNVGCKGEIRIEVTKDGYPIKTYTRQQVLDTNEKLSILITDQAINDIYKILWEISTFYITDDGQEILFNSKSYEISPKSSCPDELAKCNDNTDFIRNELTQKLNICQEESQDFKEKFELSIQQFNQCASEYDLLYQQCDESMAKLSGLPYLKCNIDGYIEDSEGFKLKITFTETNGIDCCLVNIITWENYTYPRYLVPNWVLGEGQIKGNSSLTVYIPRGKTIGDIPFQVYASYSSSCVLFDDPSKVKNEITKKEGLIGQFTTNEKIIQVI